MDCKNLYKCLSDDQRIRILNLLQDGPLCVCHIEEILETEQVKISKQLRYMRELEIVGADRVAQWMVYSLLEAWGPLLTANLETLKASKDIGALFESDLVKRREIVSRSERLGESCSGALK